MTKIRIYDLAKQIEKESKEIIAVLKEQGRLQKKPQKKN